MAETNSKAKLLWFLHIIGCKILSIYKLSYYCSLVCIIYFLSYLCNVNSVNLTNGKKMVKPSSLSLLILHVYADVLSFVFPMFDPFLQCTPHCNH